MVYLYLYGLAARARWKPLAASLRFLAESTGLSKSAVQTALESLRRRELIETTSEHATSVPERAAALAAVRRGRSHAQAESRFISIFDLKAAISL